MKALVRSDDFNADVVREWLYLEQISERLADRFVDGVEKSIHLLSRHPGLGHPGRYRDRRLTCLRVWPVAKPFRKWLIFYWDRPENVHLFRLMYGTRDLSRRLVE